VGSSLKFCLIAEGLANFYIRTGHTMEWDIAAGNAVLNTANANILDTNLNKLQYGKDNFKNQAFVAFTKDLEANIIKKCLSDTHI
jgi:3'(2'), 5'-bisphosphate nucleotidase